MDRTKSHDVADWAGERPFDGLGGIVLSFRTHSPPCAVVFSDKGTSRSLSWDGVPIDYYDTEGRLLGVYDDDRAYRRGLDNRLLEKYRIAGDRPRVRRDVEDSRKQEIIKSAYARAKILADQLRRGAAGDFRSLAGPVPIEPAGFVLDRLAPILHGYDRLESDRARFAEIYAPVSILPPDLYMSLVIQMTIGCSYNRCTFCDFYQGSPFRVRTPTEFRAHIRGVLAFFGSAASLRKSVFLADGNALVIAQAKLIERLDVVHEFFQFVPPEIAGRANRAAWRRRHPDAFDGLYSFLDAFSTMKKAVADFVALRDRHLRRVYIGLESGCDDLLRFLRKPGDASTMVDAVRTIRAAGVSVGVILMVGAGGNRYADEHVRRTIETVNAMELGPEDYVYLSDFVNHPGMPYERLAREDGIADLDWPAIVAQREAIRAGFRWPDSSRPPRISLYDIREFVY